MSERVVAVVTIEALLVCKERRNHEVKIAIHIEVEELCVVVVGGGVRRDAAGDVCPGIASMIIAKKHLAVARPGVGSKKIEISVAIDVAEVVGVRRVVRGQARLKAGEVPLTVVDIQATAAIDGAAAGDVQIKIKVAINISKDAVLLVTNDFVGSLRRAVASVK